jgi:long-chain acyl-CoA synthetase
MVHVTTRYNLSSLLEAGAAAHPDRDAIVAGHTRLTYAQVNAMACQVAGMLAARGIKPGDKVALTCPNIPHFTIAYFGILKAGATVVPLNVLLKAREVAYHLNDCDAKAYLCFEGTPELPMAQAGHAGFTQAPNCEHFIVITVDPATPSPVGGTETLATAIAGQPPTFGTQQTDEDDTAVILYTSGTTGQPKGAELRHRNLRDNVLVGAQTMGASAEHPDTSLAVLPLFHAFGQTAVQNQALCYGGTLIMLPRFEPLAALRLMQKEKVTHFAGVPTMYWGLLNALDEARDEIDLAALKQNIRIAVSGGSALPVEIHRAFEARFGVTILEGYGLSETSPVASFSILGEPPRPGSIGVPIPGVEMDLVVPETWTPVEWAPDAVGEIVIRGTNVMKGYYKRPAATAAVISPDGWFRSGDLARRDADGWYYIVDRTKDLIIRGGFNVYPREVEEVLMTHPAVSLAAVIGVPDEVHGEEVKAFVILKPGATATPGELVSWSRENMAAYKYPRTVQIVDALPMTATGKILKRELALRRPGDRDPTVGCPGRVRLDRWQWRRGGNARSSSVTACSASPAGASTAGTRSPHGNSRGGCCWAAGGGTGCSGVTSKPNPGHGASTRHIDWLPVSTVPGPENHPEVTGSRLGEGEFPWQHGSANGARWRGWSALCWSSSAWQPGTTTRRITTRPPRRSSGSTPAITRTGWHPTCSSGSRCSSLSCSRSRCPGMSGAANGGSPTARSSPPPGGPSGLSA